MSFRTLRRAAGAAWASGICLAVSWLLIPASAGFAQNAGTFPDQPFNGLQITYTIGGATVADSKDKPGFTTSRILTGTVGSGALTVSGSASVSAGFGAMVTVTLSSGNKTETFKKDLVRSGGSEAPSTAFNLSVPVAAGASASFEIRMDGRYSMGGGHRGLVVSGYFTGLAVPKPPPPPAAKPPAKTETFRISGTARDANGNPLPTLQVLVTLGGKEKAVAVNDQGLYEHKADLPVPLSPEDEKARIRVFFNGVRNGKTWFQLAMFPRPAKLSDRIMAAHKFDLDEQTTDVRKDIDFGSSEWSEGALTNIDAPEKLRKISVIFRNHYDAWAFAVEKLKVDLSRNIPLLVEIESNEPTVFDYPNRKVRLEREYTLNVPSNTFVQYHEFGHYVQYTAYGNRYVESAAGESDPRNKPHGGYANDDTGDSFIEGFATYYAGLVTKHRAIAPVATGVIGTFGSLEDPWKVWEREGKDEEFAFASVLWDLDTKAGLGYAGVWDVLKQRRATFWMYYEAFLKAHEKMESKINDCFLRHGVYSIKTEGNKTYDPGEAFIDMNGNGVWDSGEPFIDYSVDADGKRSMAATPDAVIGQSANYERVDKRFSTFRFPNSFLRLEGNVPDRLLVRVARRDGSLAYEYLAPVFENRLHLPLLPLEVDADVAVRAVSGVNREIFYEKNTAELNALFDMTRSADGLEAVVVPPGAGTPESPQTAGAFPGPSSADPSDFLLPVEAPDSGGVSGGVSGGGGPPPAGPRPLWPAVAIGALILMAMALGAGIFYLRRSGQKPAVAVRLDVLGHDGRRESFHLTKVRTRVGRSGDNDLVIDDPEVSGRHLEIVATANGLTMRDLGSANGTQVNGRLVREQSLQGGDEIVLGRTTLRLVF
ncbi:MAG: FHA domain-containing protein [Candidatus Aminicenantes bacterium]|nr:FHA domain-containing protein [Candidatus Aminicenantes bacterium]